MKPERIVNPAGEQLAFAYTPGRDDGHALVVMGHGVTSDKDRPWSEGLAAALRERGVASLRIAFSGNGESEGRFLDSTITKEVADLGAVLDAVEATGARRVAYVGHSMGGAVGLVRATTDERIAALVSLAAVTHTAAFVRRVFGHLEFGAPMLDKPACPYGRTLEDDLLRLDSLAPRAREVRVPWLIVHGTEDEIVPLQDSLDLHEAATDAELVVLDEADHSFTEDFLPRMVDPVAGWLARRLT